LIEFVIDTGAHEVHTISGFVTMQCEASRRWGVCASEIIGVTTQPLTWRFAPHRHENREGTHLLRASSQALLAIIKN